ncbi:PREDICTED: uncharacterized protein LOC104763162 [Camelina sativa]|uniref:ATP-dependent DNA helicase n=1 Tax=Camelina sativa TaxID=90675 RepID=A0ABM0XES6_CAMSA|nr:PREDICTED: uncharacterized protein LOC104763162 [Camelina sativa]
MDGASRGNPGLAAVGGIVRDHDGNWCVGFSLNIGICSAPLARLCGCIMGCMWLGKDGIDHENQKLLLRELQKLLKRNGCSLKKYNLMPQISLEDATLPNQFIMDELNYNREDLTKKHVGWKKMLIEEHKKIYDEIMEVLSMTKHLAVLPLYCWKEEEQLTLGREAIVIASLNSSYLWNQFKVLRLTKNMRLLQDIGKKEASEIEEFSKWILAVGEGKINEPNDGVCEIDIPQELLIPEGSSLLESIIEAVYGKNFSTQKDPKCFQERAILCPTNEDVNSINDVMLSSLNG